MNWFFLTGEYPPEPGGVADHTAALVQDLAEWTVVPVVLCGGDAGLSVELTVVYFVNNGRLFELCVLWLVCFVLKYILTSPNRQH